MSHVFSSAPPQEISSMAVVERAVALMAQEGYNVEIVDQKTYRTWATDYGSFVGDYATPKGFKTEDLGKNAVKVIRLAGLSDEERNRSGAPYEVGVCENPEKPGTLVFLYDFYGDAGMAIETAVGDKLDRLFMFTSMAAQEREAERLGDRLTWTKYGEDDYLATIDTQMRVQEVY